MPGCSRGLRQIVQQPPHRSPCDRITQIGCDLRERLEDEPPIAKTGVRDRHTRRVNNPIAVENQIEIERARRAWRRPRAAALALQCEQQLDELRRVEIRPSGDRGIQVRRLRVWNIDRIGFENRRRSEIGEMLSQSIERPTQVCATITEVGAERNRNKDRGKWHSVYW